MQARLGNKKAVCANLELGNVSLDDRCAGFAKCLGVDVPVLNGVMDPTEMKNRIISYLNSNAGREFLLTVELGGTEPGLMALDELGLTGKVKIGTFDLSPTMTSDVRDETVSSDSLLCQLLSRPELGAAAGTILVFGFFAVTAGGSGLYSAKGIINFLQVSAQLGILAAPVALLMIAG